MIVIVLGMHKSGTTLVAKTLHESGINMGVAESGDYPKVKYEDKRVAEITKQFLYGRQKRHSLQLPEGLFDEGLLTQMHNYVKIRSGDWGFKFPDVTLCYDDWRVVLPDNHIAIGVKRDHDAIIAHYKRRKKHNHSTELIQKVIDEYERHLDAYEIPIIRFEDYINNGPGCLEDILAVKLKDCRRTHGK